jgi:hypothetical protein
MSKAKPAHNISQYRDGNVWVAFCTVCSQEESDLSNPCPGKFVGIKKPSCESVDKRVDKAKEPS